MCGAGGGFARCVARLETRGCEAEPTTVGEASLEATPRSHPFDVLAGHGRDQVVVGVVVQDDKSGALGCGGDQEIRKADRSMLSFPRELGDDVLCSFEVLL